MLMQLEDKGMVRAIIRMPRLNANEDEVKISTVHVPAGAGFTQGQLLFSLETTKVAVDVEAPADGEIVAMLVAPGTLVPVGAPLCHALFARRIDSDELDIDWVDDFGDNAAGAADRTPRISTKARLRARQLGIEIDAVPATDGMVRVGDVEQFHRRGNPAATPASRQNPSPAPAILSRYGGSDAIIMGGGGHARAIIDAAQGSGYRLIGATDDILPAGTPVLGDLLVLGDRAMLEMLYDRGVRTAFVGVGGAVSNAARQKIHAALEAFGFHLPPLVARSAHLGPGSDLGPATYLFPGANVGPAVRIGRNCIINQNAVVAHDCVVGDDVHLTPNAVLAGHCHVGDRSTIGMCATLLNGVRVGSDCLVHNGIAVVRDLPDNSILTARSEPGKHISGGTAPECSSI